MVRLDLGHAQPTRLSGIAARPAPSPQRGQGLSLRPANDFGALRLVLDAARAEEQCSREALTVLSVRHDPYRLEGDKNRAEGKWLAGQIDSLYRPNQRVHIRGLHYALFAKGNVRKPDGEIYSNSIDDYEWLGFAVKKSRWLGILPFERISDNRNAEPLIYRANEPIESVHRCVLAYVSRDEHSLLIGDLLFSDPHPALLNFERRQPFALTIFGEKSSLEDMLLPIAQRYGADLFLPTGEISDTLMYRMAKDGAKDGRPMVVFTISDFDPAGHQMSVSIGRKLQALRDLCFPGLRFELVPVALTIDQVRELNLPSTPLKETERRADKWREEFGVEQTEIDALATLQPLELHRIVEEAVTPYFDSSLARRIREARDQWVEQAQQVIDAHIDADEVDELRQAASDIDDEVSAFMEGIAERVDDLDERLKATAEGIELPQPILPKPELGERVPHAVLISSKWSWVEGTRALKARKAYGGEGEI
jgi:hypothetical protein